MTKDNEEIHVHIIEEDYKSNKRKQEQQFEVSGKADITAELMQNNPSIMQKLQNMHGSIDLDEDLTEEDAEYIKQLSSYSTPELFSAFQDMKNRETNLLEKKQNLLQKQQDIRTFLIHEIATKRRSIKTLESEVVESQNACKEIEQALGIDINS